VNRKPLIDRVEERVLWHDSVARRMTVVQATGGFALSWRCGCACWNEDMVDGLGEISGDQITCRHVSSEDHLRLHWMRAAKSAKNRAGRRGRCRPSMMPQNQSAGEVPQVHFTDQSALNVDGSWKHGGRALNGAERCWLAGVGWVLPDVR
jgi:hypothetical protein